MTKRRRQELERRVAELEAAIEWVPTVNPKRVLGGREVVMAECEWDRLKRAVARKMEAAS